MAVKTEITCDVCNDPIKADRHLLRAESGSLRDRRPEIDLCPACFAGLLDRLGRGPEGFALSSKPNVV